MPPRSRRRANASATSRRAWRRRAPRPGDVVRTTVYVAAEEQALLARVWQALLDSEPSAVVRTPATLLGVRHLGYEGQLVEMECTAALPLDRFGQQSG